MRSRRSCGGLSFRTISRLVDAQPPRAKLPGRTPVGTLRFQPPRVILHYPAPVDATADGLRYPQPLPAGRLVDEDCLMLNVYTPARNSDFVHRRRRVLLYDVTQRRGRPGYLLDRDLVLGTNCRLGSLGFLALGTKETPGNNGFKDQVAALKWVQRNIAAFGGDPNLVTIAGCSVGSVSVMLHMSSPMSKGRPHWHVLGLFHRAISISRSPTAAVPRRRIAWTWLRSRRLHGYK